MTPGEAERLYKEGNFSAALSAYRQLYSETRESKHLYNIAIQLYHLDKFTEAAALLEKIRGEKTYFPDIELFVGFCYRAMKQPGRARILFNDLSRRTAGATQAKCLLMVGVLYDEQGNLAEAEHTYESLIPRVDLTPADRAQMLRRLATIKENRRDHISALSLYRESILFEADTDAALAAKFRMAMCLIELSAPGEAVDYLREIENKRPESFMGQSAGKLRGFVEAGVKNMERNMQAYE